MSINKTKDELSKELEISRARIAELEEKLKSVKVNNEKSEFNDQLRQAEIEYETIIKTSLDGFCIISHANGNFEDVNRAFSKISGYPENELLKMDIGALLANEGYDSFKSQLEGISETASGNILTKMKRKEKEIIDVEISANYLKEQKSYYLFIRDVTDSIQKEIELKAHKENLEQLVDNKTKELIITSQFQKSIYEGIELPIFVVDIDENDEFRFAGLNKAHENLTGLEDEWIRGRSVDELTPKIPPEAIKEIKQHYQDCYYAGESIQYEEMIPIDGKEFWWLTTLTPLRDDSGKISRLIGTAMYINDRKQMENELKQKIKESKKREEVIRRQAEEILEISTPILKIWDGTIAAPLIGSLDSQRTKQFMEKLLSGIVRNGAEIALIDITGVPSVDTQTAQFLIETITAAKLLGAKVILTGVSPAIAQTLVQLGIDLSDFTTQSTLAGGLLIAANLQGVSLVERSQ